MECVSWALGPRVRHFPANASQPQQCLSQRMTKAILLFTSQTPLFSSVPHSLLFSSCFAPYRWFFSSSFGIISFLMAHGVLAAKMLTNAFPTLRTAL